MNYIKNIFKNFIKLFISFIFVILIYWLINSLLSVFGLDGSSHYKLNKLTSYLGLCALMSLAMSFGLEHKRLRFEKYKGMPIGEIERSEKRLGRILLCFIGGSILLGSVAIVAIRYGNL